MRPGIVLLSTVASPHAFPPSVDHDLLLDLGHLDDPDPPRFGALRAEDAARRAATHRSRRTRLVAGAALAAALVVGAGVAVAGGQGASPVVQTATPPSTTVADLPTSLAVDPGAPTSTTAAPSPQGETTTTVVVAPPPSTIRGGPVPSVAAPPPPVTVAPGAPLPTARPPARATGTPPEGAVAAPDGLRVTLRLDATQVTAGSQVRGVVRIESTRSTSVSVRPAPCSAADLYEAGRLTFTQHPLCPIPPSVVVPAGASEEVGVTLRADASLRAGTYDAFSLVSLAPDGTRIHTEAVIVTVVRP